MASETKAADYVVKKKVYGIEIEGEEYKVRKPSYREYKAYLDKIRAADENEGGDLALDELIRLGLPEDAADNLDVDDILGISEIIFGGKKN